MDFMKELDQVISDKCSFVHEEKKPTQRLEQADLATNYAYSDVHALIKKLPDNEHQTEFLNSLSTFVCEMENYAFEVAKYSYKKGLCEADQAKTVFLKYLAIREE